MFCLISCDQFGTTHVQEPSSGEICTTYEEEEEEEEEDDDDDDDDDDRNFKTNSPHSM